MSRKNLITGAMIFILVGAFLFLLADMFQYDLPRHSMDHLQYEATGPYPRFKAAFIIRLPLLWQTYPGEDISPLFCRV
ncbi:MAG: hypothetical protein WC459_02485 [Patescibacteria group bacterium]